MRAADVGSERDADVGCKCGAGPGAGVGLGASASAGLETAAVPAGFSPCPMFVAGTRVP